MNLKQRALVPPLFLIFLILFIPSKGFSEQPRDSKIQVRGFKVIGNKVFDIWDIRAKFKEKGIKIRIDQGIKPEKKIEEEEIRELPILFPPVEIEEIEKKELEKKKFEELKIEEVKEILPLAPVVPEVEVEEIEKKGLEEKEFEKLKVEEVEEIPILPPVVVEEEEYTLEGLKKVTDVIANLYEENGYILARSYIPQQEIIDGVVTIAVVEGELGAIEVSENKYYSESYIRGWFKHLIGKPVKEDELQQAILLSNDTPSLNATTAFKKGEIPETADLIVNANDSFPVQLEFDYNNHGHPLVSRQRFGSTLQVTDPMFGSTLSLKTNMGNSLDDTFYGGIDYQLPIDYCGTKIGMRYIDADYIVGKDIEILGVQGESKILGGYITHPFIRSQVENLKGTLGFDYKRMFEYILTTQQSNDDLSVAYMRLDYDRLDDYLGSRFPAKDYLSLSYSHGFNDLLGSLKKDDAVASKSGADGRFDKLNLDYARLQRIWKELILLLRGSAQVSFNKLVSAEEFGIGGANTVRGHALSTHIGDHGYLVSLELSSPLPFIGEKTIFGKRISEIFQIALFGDHGGVYLIDPLVGEAKNDYLTSAGIGARLNLFDRINIKLDVGFPYREHELKTQHEIVYIQGTVKVLRF